MARTSRVTMEHAAERPSFDAIAAEAYAIYLAQGATHGHDLDDWLEAERRILAKAAPARHPATDLQQDDHDRQHDDERRPTDRPSATL